MSEELNDLLNEGIASFIKECMYLEKMNNGLMIVVPSQYTVSTKRGFRKHPILGGEAIIFDSCYFGKSNTAILVFKTKYPCDDFDSIEIPIKDIGKTNFEDQFGEVFKSQGYSTLNAYLDDLIHRIRYEKMELEALERIASGDSLWGSFA